MRTHIKKGNVPLRIDSQWTASMEVFCKCGAVMQLVRPRDCTITIGLQCNNKKCHKTILTEEWFYHCVANSSNATEHKGPYNYCLKCGHLKMKMIRKQLHCTYLKEGWMRKRPTNQVIGGKEFKRRYFKLGVDWKLWYFTKPQDVYSKDMIDLNFMTSIRKKHNYGIQIYESRGRKQWLFLCNSEQVNQSFLHQHFKGSVKRPNYCISNMIRNETSGTRSCCWRINLSPNRNW